MEAVGADPEALVTLAAACARAADDLADRRQLDELNERLSASWANSPEGDQ